MVFDRDEVGVLGILVRLVAPNRSELVILFFINQIAMVPFAHLFVKLLVEVHNVANFVALEYNLTQSSASCNINNQAVATIALNRSLSNHWRVSGGCGLSLCSEAFEEVKATKLIASQL